MINSKTYPIVQLERETLDELCKEVKETLAPDAVTPKPAVRQFCAADLWRIRKSARYTSHRRTHF